MSTDPRLHERSVDPRHRAQRPAAGAGGGREHHPTSTGAARAVGLVLPHLNGKLNGMAFRVPTTTVSVVDLVIDAERETSVEEVNSAFEKAATDREGSIYGILDYNEEPLVSSDYKGSPYSAVIDGLSTMVLNGTQVKVIAWYDNEWAYSVRGR